MPGGIRLLILAACVPLLIPPGVCLCGGTERVARLPGLRAAANGSPSVPGHHQHSHGGHSHHGCCCLGDLGLDEGDCLQPATTFTLVLDVPPAFHPLPTDLPRFLPPVRVAAKTGFPPHLAHLALLI